MSLCMQIGVEVDDLYSGVGQDDHGRRGDTGAEPCTGEISQDPQPALSTEKTLQQNGRTSDTAP